MGPWEGTRRKVREFVAGASRTLILLLRGLDGVLGRLDDGARAGRDALLHRAHLDAAEVTVRRALAAAPPSLRRAAGTVGRRLETVNRQVDRAFSYLPGTREWKHAALGLVLLLGVVTVSSVITPPEARPLPLAGWSPIVVGYFENGWGGMYVDSYPTLQRHAERIDIVMPFWHSIHPDGSIEDRGARGEVIDFAHRSGIQVVPLVNNAKTGFSAGFLTDPAARQEAATELRALVDRYGYDGVHLDFEVLPPYWREELTSFVAEVRAALGPGRHLSVAVFPQVDVVYAVSGAYDYAALAGLCDFIAIMGYDRHYAGGPAGPVSPSDWIEANVRYALYEVGVPAEKLVLAVGGYGYDWPAGGGQATSLPSRYAADFAARRGATLRWDGASRNPYFVYYAGRVRHDVWYQDERVMAERITQARKFRLRGLAIWRLGYETPETWTVLGGELGAKRPSAR